MNARVTTRDPMPFSIMLGGLGRKESNTAHLSHFSRLLE